MKSDQDSITGAISTTARLTHHPRDAECVLMTPHIKGDMEKVIQYSTILLQNILEVQQIDTRLKSCNLVENQVRTISSQMTHKTDKRREILLSSKVSRVEFLNSEMVVSGDDSGKTRFWNIKDGTEAQASVAGGGKFSFSKGASTKQQVGRHVITADGDLVLVHELDGAKDATGSAAVKESAAVACFRAPGRISVLDCAGDQIAVGCEDGHVLHLRAALLMQGASGHK